MFATTLAVVAGALYFAAFAAAAPSNDDFASPKTLEGDETETAGSTFGATKEPGEPNHAGDPGGASVWFAWKAPRAERVRLESCSYGGWEDVVAVYRGSSLSTLEGVGSSSSQPEEKCRQVFFRASSATTYRIAIDGYSDNGSLPAREGEFDLSLSAHPLQVPATPVNDAFAAASLLDPKEMTLLWGSTEGATREPGEPGHPGDLEGASVWYRWTAPRSIRMELFPCQGDFHPVVSVFAGTEIGSVQPVSVPVPAGNGQFCSLGGFPAVAFDAVAGVTYAISVDGADGEWGRYGVELKPTPLQFVDVFPPNAHIRKLRVLGRKVTIRFASEEGGVSFLCRLDKRPFEPCVSPKAYGHLAARGHRFQVEAVDPAGNVDRSPASVSFVVRQR